jgi:hypothetical protein
VTVSASGANTKTTSNGTANLVLASGATTDTANISLGGYNTLKVNIDATASTTKNTFGITPAGKLYFLSNLNGTIDVVKTDLDGSNRQTVLAGTGSEDANTTSLLASRDWKYLALLSKRSGDKASVYLIDTTNGDKLRTIDDGNANFSLVGWSGDNFVYLVNRIDVPLWQANAHALKSYDPDSGRLTLLDQTTAEGTSDTDYAAANFTSVFILDDQVIYGKGWNASYSSRSRLSDDKAGVYSIHADGSGHKAIKEFAIPSEDNYFSPGISLYEPQSLFIEAASDTGVTNMYEYEDGSLTTVSGPPSDSSSGIYPTYLLSPSGKSTFWAEQRDGKNALFVGDQDGKAQKQIASLSEYATYGWYTDSYVLVSKNSSELYIMSPSGGTPYKITDYYKPAITYNGYGGGYGGL